MSYLSRIPNWEAYSIFPKIFYQDVNKDQENIKKNKDFSYVVQQNQVLKYFPFIDFVTENSNTISEFRNRFDKTDSVQSRLELRNRNFTGDART